MRRGSVKQNSITEGTDGLGPFVQVHMKGASFKVSPEQYETIRGFRWSRQGAVNAQSNTGARRRSLTRELFGPTTRRRVFANGDKLDFRPANVSTPGPRPTIKKGRLQNPILERFLDEHGVYCVAFQVGGMKGGAACICEARDYEAFVRGTYFYCHNGNRRQSTGRRTYYARRNRDDVMLHTLIMGRAPKGRYIDHVNRNTMDNRRSNLRFADASLQAFNALNFNRSTGVRGVYRTSSGYEAKIARREKRFRQSFKTLEAAVAWREKVAHRLYGDGARPTTSNTGGRI